MEKENTPPAFHVMAKPTGAVCNLNCAYCFFLTKERLYPDSRFRMSEEVLEEYIRQYLEAQQVPCVTVAWQGGEPTMMGLDFFRRSIELEEKYKKPGMIVENTIQTNATLLDDEWCEFFRDNNYLVGISIDGPKELHDTYRVDKGGNPTFDRVMKGFELLKKHDVDFNILCTVHAANGDYPEEVYRFFRDELGAEFIQFIAIVERDNETGFQKGNKVTDRSVGPEQYGDFLIGVFDEWVKGDVGKVYVQIFDVSLGNWAGEPPSLCVFAPTCGGAMVMEHNGDLYSCDHFVEPDYLLGNITETPLTELVASSQQCKFGRYKLDALPAYCRDCEVRFACHGACPKNRFIETPDGEPGLNYLCAGYKAFFKRIDKPMRIMAELLRRGRAPAEVMRILQSEEEAQLQEAFAKAGRNDPCPCGSGRKFKQCHGLTGSQEGA
jgi:uncharacterized protein